MSTRWLQGGGRYARSLWLTGLLIALLGLGGCATQAKPDPLEPFNRVMFGFNETVDAAVIKPVATVYRDAVPRPLQQGVTNFFWNFSDAWSAVNLGLQGRPRDAAANVVRFGTNTVFGVFGLFDVATELGLQRQNEDLGQTLGRWGVPPGAYIVWPLFGPSSLRDSVNILADQYTSPIPAFPTEAMRNTLTATRLINVRAGLLSATKLIDELALDKYVFVRNSYLQRRRSLVYDGDPPEDSMPLESDDSSDPPPSPAAPAASH